ncbi:MAG: Band 7 protein [candidate division TM6 bacterium GW2011_GWF2_30_66]|jgi:regulator of protease activity HflC (stomatin/prohibitin superfamily)|nr:MAG: Band 7 protein [candidate division TM6 bacterium GW2011_GWF2_30_66]
MIFGFGIFFAIVLFFCVYFLIKSVYLVKQAEAIIIERLGRYSRVLTPGLHLVIPFLDNTRKAIWTYVQDADHGKHYRYTRTVTRIDLRECVYDFPRQNVISKDNVTMEINALLYYQITDPKAAVYEINNLPQAIEKLTQTTLRNIIGSMDLDETLVSRDQINERLREILDEATDKWGVKVNRVELQEVNPPLDIRQAMEKQMRAERERRAVILEAEGSKGAAILESEGVRESKVLRAKGEAEAQIELARGQAESRLQVVKAEAEAINMIQSSIKTADPLPYMIAMKYIEALPEMMKDKEGKMIVVPYEASGLIGSLASVKKIFENTN